MKMWLKFRIWWLERLLDYRKKKSQKLKAEKAALIIETKASMSEFLERRNVPDWKREKVNQAYNLVLEAEKMSKEFQEKMSQQQASSENKDYDMG